MSQSAPPFESDQEAELRACTYAGRPYGSKAFLSEMSTRFGRQWDRPQQTASEPGETPPENQLSLF